MRRLCGFSLTQWRNLSVNRDDSPRPPRRCATVRIAQFGEKGSFLLIFLYFLNFRKRLAASFWRENVNTSLSDDVLVSQGNFQKRNISVLTRIICFRDSV